MSCFDGCLSFLRCRRRLVLVRHGESEYNVHYAKHHSDPGNVWDSPLTALGERQAEELRPRLAQHSVQLAVSSPLTRAIQTCLLALPKSKGRHMVTALASEHMEASCDIGRPASRLRAAFPEVDFGELPEVWWYVPDGHEGITEEESHRLFKEEGRREGRAAFERRVECFARWLEQRPEKVIAIFAHADFFNCFLHKFFGDQAKFQDYWMKNCELLELSFTTLTPKAPPVKAQRPSVSEVHPAHPPHANHHHHQAKPGKAAEALEALRQDLARQKPQLKNSELRALAAKEWKAMSLEARRRLMEVA
ncbi:unnamed protein product [Effrenium voratum]|uniref:Uncharacterized protein n=1 Tax=Effrenium voratum TaxID=2562239 RepID=A0AA36IJD7_9DINO|nr:unnamed protein product [Effrenium voratum]